MNAEVYVGIVWVILAAGLVLLARRSCFDVPEGFYGLLYQHGKSLHRISPGRHYRWARGYSVRLVDMRKTILNIGALDLVSADHVPAKLSAVLTYQIIQAETAMHQVRDYQLHLKAAAQAELRGLIAVTELEDLLDQRWNISARLLSLVQPHADRIGIEVHAAEVCEIVLPETSAAVTRCGLFPVLPD